MCGVPYHAAEGYIARLLRAGYKIAVCDQMELPSPGKKLVRREVVRVITPGTVTSLNVLDPKENSYLAAMSRGASGTPVGLAYADVTTGEFLVTEFSGEDADEKLRDELQRLKPREILLPRQAGLFAGGAGDTDGSPHNTGARGEIARRRGNAHRGMGFPAGLRRTDAARTVRRGDARRLRPRGTSTSGLRGGSAWCTTCAKLRPRVPENGHHFEAALGHMDRVRYYEQADALVLDAVTVRNLELVAPIFAEDAGRGNAPTLLSALDETATGMGARLLRQWILRPQVNREEIEARLDAVEELKTHTVLREEIRHNLAGVQDLERLAGRVTLGVASPRDLLGLRQSLTRIPLLRKYLENCRLASAFGVACADGRAIRRPRAN